MARAGMKDGRPPGFDSERVSTIRLKWHTHHIFDRSQLPQSIGVIVQARMGSTRLPGKILRPIHSKTLLEHILYRLSFLQHEATVIVATSDSPRDDIVEDFCKQRNTLCFRGSEKNVMERYYQCAVQFAFRHVVRLTGDNPFVDVEELDRLIELHMRTRSDFSHSVASLPVGVGAEVFTFEALETSFREGTSLHHKEHVDEYMLEHPERFKTTVLTVKGKKNRPNVRLTVDTEEDYRRVCFIAEHASTEYVTTEEAVKLCLQYA